MPAIVTTSPPPVEPLIGKIPVTVGLSTKVKRSPATMALLPSALVTITFTAPATCAGATAVTVVSVTLAKLVASTVPNFTAVVPVNPVPVMVIAVPPALDPLDGAIEVTAGVAANAGVTTSNARMSAASSASPPGTRRERCACCMGSSLSSSRGRAGTHLAIPLRFPLPPHALSSRYPHWRGWESLNQSRTSHSHCISIAV